MTTLDTVIEMQRQGMTDYEISTNLQSQGISPRDINDSLNQAKIKSAVSENPLQATNPQNMTPQNINPQNQNMGQPQAGVQGLPPHPTTGPATEVTNQEITDPIANMPQTSPATGPQASIMQNTGEQMTYPVDNANAQVQNYADPSAGTDPYAGDDPYAAGGGGGEYYADEYYDDGYGDGAGYSDSETITDIAGQVVNEKFKEYNQKTGDMVMFKNMIQDKVAIMEQRIKRIEDNTDRLQQAIIQKIGEFGENTAMIRKDLENLHDTTSKLMNPLIDNIRELEGKK